MSTVNDSQTLTNPRAQAIAEENARFMSRVYRWMTLGILITGFVAYRIGSSPDLVAAILMNRTVFFGLIIAQLGAVFFLSLAMRKVSALTATFVYLLYAALSGATLSVIFLVYAHDSIANVFFVTAGAFAGLSVFGTVTKRDLGPLGTFCTMGLFGLVAFGLVSMFVPGLRSETNLQARSIIGVLVFSGLTAWDTQRIRALNIIGNEGTEEDQKEAIHGALTLYLDFVNLFLDLLRLMGRKR